MSSQDSFVDEVTEAVRRDRLYAAFRKYGWIGVLVVLGIVGGAGWSEWQKAKETARARAFGDAVQTALTQADPAARATALGAIQADGGQVAVLELLKAADPKADKAGAIKALDTLANDATQPQLYRDLAVLRKVAVAGADMPLADRRSVLSAIDIPGRPLRTLVEEQLAYLLLEEGKPADALTAMLTLYQDQEAPAGMKQRLAQVIVALGGTVPEKKAADGAAPSAG